MYASTPIERALLLGDSALRLCSERKDRAKKKAQCQSHRASTHVFLLNIAADFSGTSLMPIYKPDALLGWVQRGYAISADAHRRRVIRADISEPTRAATRQYF